MRPHPSLRVYRQQMLAGRRRESLISGITTVRLPKLLKTTPLPCLYKLLIKLIGSLRRKEENKGKGKGMKAYGVTSW